MHYVALLRGINVGGNKKVSMANLKKLFEKLGYENVSTYINSGNVLFSSKEKNAAKLATKIEKEIEKMTKFPVQTILRDEENLKKVVKSLKKEHTNDEMNRTDVLFLWDAYDSKATIKKIRTAQGIDHLTYVPGAIVWHLERKHYTKSSMRDFIGTEVYKNMTARNVNTVRKLIELIEKKSDHKK